MKNIKIKNMNSKIVIIFILGLICFSSLGLNNTSDFISKNEVNIDEGQPRSSVFLENRTDYSKQMIVDPSFDLGSPWNSQEFDETNDTDSNLNLNQANYLVTGDKRNFYLNGTVDSVDWTAVSNPEYPVLPDNYLIDSDGIYVDHIWDEGVDQTRNTPSIQWKQNFTMPVNMSDYTITSASVESLFNATVTPSPTLNGIETLYDSVTQMATGDYVTFYILISDLENNKVYRIAYNKTSYLGRDAPSIPSIVDSLMTNVTEDVLLFYLSSVLETDHENFTITIGVDIYCEDNIGGVDRDYWDELRIKTLNITFAYEKKINQLTSVSWNQTGNEIDNGEYELGDDGYFIINNASLNFDYDISEAWPSTSLNSEFRIYLNNYQISNTIKLTNFSTSIQNQNFDISPSLINAAENITIKIQLYIADNFLLDNNISVSIDNVNLTTYFTVVERRNPIPTNLETTTGYLSRSVPWNESFVISLNYTNASNQVPITGGNFIVEWSDSYEIQEVGGGIYNLLCNNTLDASSLAYTLKISVNITNTWYESETLELKIYLIGRDSYTKAFLENEDISSSDEIEAPFTSQLNFSFFYYDTISSEQLLDFDMSLSGLDVSSYSSTHNSTAYNFVINTTQLGLGVHIASFLTEKTNFQPISKIIQISVRQIHTEISTNNANQSYTIEIGQDFDLNIFIEDVDFGRNISGCVVNFDWRLGSGVINETESGTYSMTLEDLSRGNYIIYVSVFKGPEYKFEQFEITLNVINPITSDQGIPDFVFYIMGVMMVGLVASFIAYQQYFKFPKSVREIKSLSKAIKKGKAAEKVLSVKTADDLFVEDYISKTKGSLPSKNKALMKDRMGTGSSQKSMTKGDIKKDIKGEKVEKKLSPEVSKEVKKPYTSRKPSPLEDSLELPKGEPKKVEPIQKVEKLKSDQFVKPHNIETSDLKQISTDQKPKKIRYLRKPKIKELPKKTPKKPKKD